MLGAALAADALRTLGARPLRAFGMMAGVVIGVAAGCFSLAFTASERAQVRTQFDRQLSPVTILEFDAVLAAPESAASRGVTLAWPLSPLDSDAEAEIPGAPATYSGGEFSTWRRSGAVAVNPHAAPTNAPIFGVTSGGLRAAGVRLISGMDPADALGVEAAGPRGTLPVVWVGQDLAADLGITMDSPHGQSLIADGRVLTVGGIVSPGTRFPSVGRSVLVPSWYAHDLWAGAEQPRVLAHVRRGAAGPARDYLISTLDPTGAVGIRDGTPPDGRRLQRDVGEDVERAGLALSAVAMLIGGISVANVLSISVFERVREFGGGWGGGWPIGRLAGLVVTEAALAGVLAAVVGTGLGLGAATILCNREGWQLVMPTLAVWAPAAGGIGAAVVGGVLPAVRAGLVEPVSALRG